MAERGKPLAKVGLVLSLATAVLVLSGCWARAFGPSDGQQFLVINSTVSDRIVFDSTARCGSGYSRGTCALETVRALCLEVPIVNPVSDGKCWSITWEDHRYDIDAEIHKVATGETDCLAAHLAVPGPPWWDWVSLPMGAYGCAPTSGGSLPGTG